MLKYIVKYILMLKYIVKQVNYFAVLADKYSAGKVRWHPTDIMSWRLVNVFE